MSDAEYIADLAVKADLKPVVLKNDSGREFLVAPAECSVTEVSERHTVTEFLPDVIEQRITLSTPGSLIEYVNRYQEAQTSIFADVTNDCITAVIDYHGPGEPDFCRHVVIMSLMRSESWNVWSASNNKMMDQLEFARFLEENALDIVGPSGADLLEITRDLQANRKSKVGNIVRTSTDHQTVEFTDETTVTSRRGNVELPTKMLLHFPVYMHGPAESAEAFLRWRLEESVLKLGYAVRQLEAFRQQAFFNIVDGVRTATKCPTYYGRAALLTDAVNMRGTPKTANF